MDIERIGCVFGIAVASSIFGCAGSDAGNEEARSSESNMEGSPSTNASPGTSSLEGKRFEVTETIQFPEDISPTSSVTIGACTLSGPAPNTSQPRNDAHEIRRGEQLTVSRLDYGIALPSFTVSSVELQLDNTRPILTAGAGVGYRLQCKIQAGGADVREVDAKVMEQTVAAIGSWARW